MQEEIPSQPHGRNDPYHCRARLSRRRLRGPDAVRVVRVPGVSPGVDRKMGRCCLAGAGTGPVFREMSTEAAGTGFQIGTSTHSPGPIASIAAAIPSARASMRGQDVDIRTSTDSRRRHSFGRRFAADCVVCRAVSRNHDQTVQVMKSWTEMQGTVSFPCIPEEKVCHACEADNRERPRKPSCQTSTGRPPLRVDYDRPLNATGKPV